MNHIVRQTLFLILTVFCFLALPISVYAQWNSFIINYKKESFGRGSQTWQIRAYDEHRIYGGNKNGLLQFNGDKWDLLPLNNRMDVRSIWPSEKQKRIYVGGEGEFGYFEPTENGSLIYTELSVSFNQQHNYSGGYWGVFEVDNLMYYVSDWYIVKQLDNTYTPIESLFKIDCSGVVNGVLYVGTSDGIKMLIGNTLLPLPNGDILKGKTIRSITSCKQGVLIATAFDGLFYVYGNEVTPFVTGEESFMRINEIFSMAVSDKYIAIGTIQKGLLLIDTETNSKKFYNENNGLQNNTILSIAFDKTDNLWLGLDNGIDYIPLNEPYTNLYTYPHSKGAGYTAILKDSILFLGTNRGLYSVSYPVHFTDEPNKFNFFPELSGQVWDLAQVDNDIFCMHDKGLFILYQNKEIELIPGMRGALSGIAHLTDKNKYWISAYDGIYLLEKEQNKWRVKDKIKGINDWIKNMAFEKPDLLWIRMINEGIRCIQIDTTDYSIKEQKSFTNEHGLTSLEGLYLHSLPQGLYFSSTSGIYQYNSSTNKMEISELLSDWLMPDKIYKPIKSIQSDGTHLYALTKDMIRIARFSPDGEYLYTESYPFKHQNIDFIPYYEQFTILSDSRIIVPNEEGFALLNIQNQSSGKSFQVFINQVFITYPQDSLLYTDNFIHNITIPQISYSNNGLRFEYAVRSFSTGNDIEFRSRLLPDTTWSNVSSAKVKEYNNLKEGKYIFEVIALLPDGNQTSAQYEFTILPPWYRTVYAWLGYIFLFICFLGILYKWEEHRLVRKQQAELDKKDYLLRVKEEEFLQETVRKEQQIIELKNENLEQELKFKSQEMANLMINLSRKNEILLSIKQDLYKVINEMKGENFVKYKRMLLSLNSSIDLNMESDDLLKKFEEQFNLVHNNFIKKIDLKHPDLTVSEKKMCVYIKMNLSTKEMAPLLNISIRGVETLRYRLRKKIGLDRDASLSEYLKLFES